MVNTEEPSKPAVIGFDPWSVLAQVSLGSTGLLIGGASSRTLGRLVRGGLNLRFSETGNWVFAGSTIILPPVGATTLSEQAVINALSTAFRELDGVELSDSQLAKFCTAIKVVHSPSLETTDLVARVNLAESNHFIFVVEASKYRSSDVLLPPAFGMSAVRSLEDIWVPHVAYLGQAAVSYTHLTLPTIYSV